MLSIVPAEVLTLLNQQSLAALLPALPAVPPCPQCGGKMLRSSDCMGFYYECENMGLENGDCYGTLSVRELEGVA